MKNPTARQRCGVYWYGGEGVPLPPIASLVRTAGSLSALGAIGKYRLRSCGALPICKFAKRRTSLFMLMFDSGSAGTSMSSSIGGRSPVSWRLPSDKVRDVTGTPATELALPTARGATIALPGLLLPLGDTRMYEQRFFALRRYSRVFSRGKGEWRRPAFIGGGEADCIFRLIVTTLSSGS